MQSNIKGSKNNSEDRPDHSLVANECQKYEDRAKKWDEIVQMDVNRAAETGASNKGNNNRNGRNSYTKEAKKWSVHFLLVCDLSRNTSWIVHSELVPGVLLRLA
jgi:hypothetical protein